MVPGLSPAASYEQRWVPCSNETANLLSAGEVGGSDSEVLKNAFPLPPLPQSCDSRMLVKENLHRKKMHKNSFNFKMLKMHSLKNYPMIPYWTELRKTF